MAEIKNRIKIAKSFGAASRSYDISARLQRYCGKHLMHWLPNRNDLTVLDLGSGTGFFTDILASKFEQVIGIDISKQMLNFAKENRHQDIHWLEADMYQLPLQSQSVDLIYCNLVIQWCEPLEKALTEILRVLKPGGLFIFSTLTEGTLYELRSAWAQVDNDQHVIDFKSQVSLEQVFNTSRSLILQQKSDQVVLEYENVVHLAHELKGIGANHLPRKSNKGLAGKTKWQQMTNAYQDFVEPSGIVPATYNVFSGLVVKLHE